MNEDPNESLIRNLRSEIEELRRKIAEEGEGGSGSRPGSGKGGMSLFGAKLMAAAAVEKQKEQLMEELQEKLMLEALESVGLVGICFLGVACTIA